MDGPAPLHRPDNDRPMLSPACATSTIWTMLESRICVTAREHKSPGPRTSAFPGPDWLRISGCSGPHYLKMGPDYLRIARQHRPGTPLIENGDKDMPAAHGATYHT